jgi:glycosyltransferase involved in cell wall biosynthesis
MKIVLVIANMDYGGAARQLLLLAPHLPRDRFEIRVLVLGEETPWVRRLRSSGVGIEALGWRRFFQPQPFASLWRLIRSFDPAVIHAWQLPAYRAVALMTRRKPLLAGFCLRLGDRQEPAGRLDSWLLKRAQRILVAGETHVERCRQSGFRSEQVMVIPPGVDNETPSLPAPVDLGVPPGARVILCVGRLEPRNGFRDAVWAFDILQYLYDDLHLVVAGDGSERDPLQGFARITAAPKRIHLLGWREDVPALLARADVVWVPGLAEGGGNVVLEAMAAGRPIVASRLRGLAEIVVEGETGLLIPPGDKAALARHTRLLLENPGRCRQLGEAGQLTVARCFSRADLVKSHVRLYEEFGADMSVS